MTENKITDADIAKELEIQELINKSIKAEKELAAARALEEKNKTKKQKRIELEKRFIGRVICEANYKGDIRKYVSKLSADYGINWRRFIDKRHRAIWRALETLNLRSTLERMEIIENEAYDNPKHLPLNYSEEDRNLDGDDPVRGQPGSAAWKEFEEKIVNETHKAIIWFERELEAAEAFQLVGGKIYLREIAEIGENEISFPDQLAMMMNGR